MAFCTHCGHPSSGSFCESCGTATAVTLGVVASGSSADIEKPVSSLLPVDRYTDEITQSVVSPSVRFFGCGGAY